MASGELCAWPALLTSGECVVLRAVSRLLQRREHAEDVHEAVVVGGALRVHVRFERGADGDCVLKLCAAAQVVVLQARALTYGNS